EPGSRQSRGLARRGQEGRAGDRGEGGAVGSAGARDLDGRLRERGGRRFRERGVRGARRLRGGDGRHRERGAEVPHLRHLRRRGIRGWPDVWRDHPHLRRAGGLV
ncbi:Xanthine and CO dehydrogenases maturation factor, XdhC/CoxF family, partial [uncultured Rubrobacteraceae bacterium]